MNNRQVALIAAATYHAGFDGVARNDVQYTADRFTEYLNRKDQELDQEMRDLGIRE